MNSSVNFIENNINNKKILFIVSGESKIQLKSKFRRNTINAPNFIFDTTLLPLREKVVSMAYPRVFFIEHGRIIKFEEANNKVADKVFADAIHHTEK